MNVICIHRRNNAGYGTEAIHLTVKKIYNAGELKMTSNRDETMAMINEEDMGMEFNEETMETALDNHNGSIDIVELAKNVLAEHDAEQAKDNPALVELRIVEDRLKFGRKHPDMMHALELDETDPEMANELTKEFYESITDKNIKKLRKDAGRHRDNAADMFQKTLGLTIQKAVNRLADSDEPGIYRVFAGVQLGSVFRTVINRVDDDSDFEVSVVGNKISRSNNEKRPYPEVFHCTQVELIPDEGEAVYISGRDYIGGTSASHAFCVDYAVQSGVYESNGLAEDGKTIIADSTTPYDPTTPSNSIARYTVDGGSYKIAAALLEQGYFKTISFLTRDGCVVQHMEMVDDGVGSWRRIGALVDGIPESPSFMIREWATKEK